LGLGIFNSQETGKYHSELILTGLKILQINGLLYIVFLEGILMTDKLKITNAVGTRGFVLHTIDGYVFRVYNKDHSFTDYDLHHFDLEVIIVDEDAFFYPDSKGKDRGTLDYSPGTRGLDIK